MKYNNFLGDKNYKLIARVKLFKKKIILEFAFMTAVFFLHLSEDPQIFAESKLK